MNTQSFEQIEFTQIEQDRISPTAGLISSRRKSRRLYLQIKDLHDHFNLGVSVICGWGFAVECWPALIPIHLLLMLLIFGGLIMSGYLKSIPTSSRYFAWFVLGFAAILLNL